MAKPKMPEEDRIDAGLRTRALILEIKQLSGLSAERLSEAFKNCKRGLDISGGLLRQYLTGKKPASMRRRKAIALAAKDLGWSGQECEETIYWAWATIDQGLRPGQVIYDAEQDAQRSLSRLEHDLDGLLSLGYDELQLLFIAAAKIRSLAPNHDRHGVMAGIVAPASLPIDGYENTGPMWMKLTFKSLDEVTPADLH